MPSEESVARRLVSLTPVNCEELGDHLLLVWQLAIVGLRRYGREIVPSLCGALGRVRILVSRQCCIAACLAFILNHVGLSHAHHCLLASRFDHSHIAKLALDLLRRWHLRRLFLDEFLQKQVSAVVFLNPDLARGGQRDCFLSLHQLASARSLVQNLRLPSLGLNFLDLSHRRSLIQFLSLLLRCLVLRRRMHKLLVGVFLHLDRVFAVVDFLRHLGWSDEHCVGHKLGDFWYSRLF